MAYRFKVNSKWILCPQEDNELLIDLKYFLAAYNFAKFPDGSYLRPEEIMKAKELAIQRWCQVRSINLSWIGRPSEVVPYRIDQGGIVIRGLYNEYHYLLVFEEAKDAMLFKLHFNNDARADS